MTDTLADFQRDTFTADGVTKDVYRAGEGPGVLFVHEVPGITPECAAFARRLVDADFTVAMPDLLGDAGRPATLGYAAQAMPRMCISREFQAFALKADRPIVRYLRALGRDLHQRAGGAGIGAVGMCFSGGFALALAADPHVLAPVLSQPSLPLPITPAHRRDIGLPDDQAQVVADRCAAEDLTILGLRFEGDVAVPPARFAALQERFGDAFEAVVLSPREHKAAIASLPADQRPDPLLPTPHSVLGADYVEVGPTRAALDRVLALFDRQLRPAGPGEPGS